MAFVRLAVIILSSITIAILNSIGDITVSNIHKLESNSNVDCSDEFSRVEIGPAMDQMDESNALLDSGIVCMIITYLLMVLECFCACGCVCAAKNCGSCKDRRSRRDWADFKEEAKYFFFNMKKFNWATKNRLHHTWPMSARETTKPTSIRWFGSGLIPPFIIQICWVVSST